MYEFDAGDKRKDGSFYRLEIICYMREFFYRRMGKEL